MHSRITRRIVETNLFYTYTLISQNSDALLP